MTSLAPHQHGVHHVRARARTDHRAAPVHDPFAVTVMIFLVLIGGGRSSHRRTLTSGTCQCHCPLGATVRRRGIRGGALVSTVVHDAAMEDDFSLVRRRPSTLLMIAGLLAIATLISAVVNQNWWLAGLGVVLFAGVVLTYVSAERRRREPQP